MMSIHVKYLNDMVVEFFTVEASAHTYTYLLDMDLAANTYAEAL